MKILPEINQQGLIKGIYFNFEISGFAPSFWANMAPTALAKSMSYESTDPTVSITFIKYPLL